MSDDRTAVAVSPSTTPTTTDTCPKCGKPLTGGRFVDGTNPDGTPFGYFELFCEPCDDPRPYPPQDDLRKARVARRMSIRDAATALGVEPAFLSGVEFGKVEPTPGMLDAMRALYEVQP